MVARLRATRLRLAFSLPGNFPSWPALGPRPAEGRLGVDDPTPVAFTVEACGQNHGQYSWHLTDADGVLVRVSPEPYGTAEDAGAAGQTALEVFEAGQS